MDGRKAVVLFVALSLFATPIAASHEVEAAADGQASGFGHRVLDMLGDSFSGGASFAVDVVGVVGNVTASAADGGIETARSAIRGDRSEESEEEAERPDGVVPGLPV